MKRLLARVRTISPTLPLVPGVVVGQVVIWRVGFPALAALFLLVGWLAIHRTLIRSWIWAITAGVGVGMVSTVAVLPRAAGSDLQGAFWARVAGVPQYPVPGRIVFGVQVLGPLLEGRASEEWGKPVTAWCKAIDLPWREASALRAGDLIAFRGDLRALRSSREIFSRDAGLARRGYTHLCTAEYVSPPLRRSEPWPARARTFIVERVRSLIPSGERSGLVLSLAFGVRNGLTKQTEAAFRAAGLSHLLVFSGYQVALVYYLLFAVSRLLLRRLSALRGGLPFSQYASLCSFILTLAFIQIVGIESSSLRAALALAMLVLTAFGETSRSPGNKMVVSFLLLSLLWPGCYLEPGVQLTFAALFGIWLGSLSADSRLYRYAKVCWLVTAATSLVGAAWFPSSSLIAPLANFFLAPLFSVIGCEGVLISFGAHLIGADADGLLLQGVAGLLDLLRAAVVWLGALPWAEVEQGRAPLLLACGTSLFVAGWGSLGRFRKTFGL